MWYLTIDIALQEAAELALENGVASIQAKIDSKKEQQIASGTYKEKQDVIDGASVVVVNVKTGEPLAIANWPTYDPSELLEKYNELACG